MANPSEAFGLKIGERIRLVKMGPDPYPIESGATGTVYMMCDAAGLEQVCVEWDNGRNLNLVPGTDEWEKIS